MTLRDISTVRAGYPIRGEITPARDGEVAIVQRRDVQPEQEIRLDQLDRIHLPGKRKPDYLEQGDILFVGRVDRHRQPFAVRIEQPPDRTVAAPQFFMIRITAPTVSSGYLTWYLNVMAQPFWAKHAVGTAILNVPRSALEALPLILPPFDVQEQVAHLHAARRREKALIEMIDSKRQELLDAVLKQTVQRYS
jgi:hypothetical protein